MSFGMFLSRSARYRHFLGDGEDREYSAGYDEFTLSSVAIEESERWDSDGGKIGESRLYYFIGKSRCANEMGEEVPLPRCARGDICIIDGRETRVTRVEYFDNGRDGMRHVRITLI
ncbi:MAG: hypothetical protein E7628_03430 [Ruminococcaceae bacterium]|nr:hypothetical protein [Oscillospiraceae bacterium]